jgi:serine/threonine-protein kinase
MTMTVSAASSAAIDLRSGDILGGKYELIQPLGVGGMGTVWTACNLITGAQVAAKVLLLAHAISPDGVIRFRREAQATAALSHRAIVCVFDLIEIDPARGSLVMIMERLRGHTLAREIESLGCLSVQATLEVVFPILSALSLAHGLGIVHRDLKPENIFLALEPDGQRQPKILDFGISKLLWQHPITLDGYIVGTPGYMSPEQTLGIGVDTRSDLFSVGILLYECLSGRSPFHNPFMGATLPRDLMSLFEVEARPLEQIPAALWDVIRRALARRVTDRFDSAVDLADALRRAVPDEFLTLDRSWSSAMPPRPATRARVHKSFRWPHLVFAGALLATLPVIMVSTEAPATGPHAGANVHLAEVNSRFPHPKRAVAHLDTFPFFPAPSVETDGEPPASSARVRRPLTDTPAASGPVRTGVVLKDPGF